MVGPVLICIIRQLRGKVYKSYLSRQQLHGAEDALSSVAPRAGTVMVPHINSQINRFLISLLGPSDIHRYRLTTTMSHLQNLLSILIPRDHHARHQPCMILLLMIAWLTTVVKWLPDNI